MVMIMMIMLKTVIRIIFEVWQNATVCIIKAKIYLS